MGKLGALTQRLKIEIKYLFRQSLTSSNKQHTHSIFWIKYVFLAIFSTLTWQIQQDSSTSPVEEGKHWGCPTFWSRQHKLFLTRRNIYAGIQYENHLLLLSKGERNGGNYNPLRIQHVTAMWKLQHSKGINTTKSS